MSASTVTLAETPGMGAAFARAMIPSRSAEAALPERTVVIEGVRQDPARLAEYDRVCGFTLRSHVPPTWLHVLTFPLHVHLLGAADSTVRLVGAVHVSNRMTLHRPVSAQETLTVAVRAAHLRPHARGALLDLVGEISVGDEVVWDGVSTYLASGARVAGDPVELPRTPFAPEPPQAMWRLPADLGRRYRAVSKDPNPIHTSKVMARAFGFARPLIHGMWTHAHGLAALEGRLPDAYSTEVSFARPVLLPGTVGFVSRRSDSGWTAAVTTKDGSKPHLTMAVET